MPVDGDAVRVQAVPVLRLAVAVEPPQALVPGEDVEVAVLAGHELRGQDGARCDSADVDHVLDLAGLRRRGDRSCCRWP